MSETVEVALISVAAALGGSALAFFYQARLVLRERRLDKLGVQWAKLLEVIQGAVDVDAGQMQQFRRELALWASRGAIKRYDEWAHSAEELQRARNEHNPPSEEDLFKKVSSLTYKLVVAGRRELGHRRHPGKAAVGRLFLRQ